MKRGDSPEPYSREPERSYSKMDGNVRPSFVWLPNDSGERLGRRFAARAPQADALRKQTRL